MQKYISPEGEEFIVEEQATNRILNEGIPFIIIDIKDRRLTIKEDDLFVYCNMQGNIPVDNTSGLGFYTSDTRFLSCWELYLNGRDKVHLSKNPIFAGRVASLLEAFPDARIVVPVRNPYETIPSLLKLMRGSWKARGWPAERIQRSLAALAAQSFHTYRYPLEVLARHPDARRAIVDYRELVAKPRRTLERVYQELGFQASPELRERLAAEEERARAHEAGHRYSLEEFGLAAGAIRAELTELFERFGWEGAERRAGSSGGGDA